jgi:hypothetical protein
MNIFFWIIGFLLILEIWILLKIIRSTIIIKKLEKRIAKLKNVWINENVENI